MGSRVVPDDATHWTACLHAPGEEVPMNTVTSIELIYEELLKLRYRTKVLECRVQELESKDEYLERKIDDLVDRVYRSES
jgi:hypothetical protein